MNQQSSNLPQTRFTGIFIPAEVLQLENITLMEMMLLSWIDALFCKQKGGCFASNEYLASKLRVKENTIAKSLTNLRQLGYIEDVSFDGRTRVIKAKIGKIIDESQSNADLDLNPTPIGKKSNPAMDKNPNPSYIESKEERKDYILSRERDKRAAPAAPKKNKDFIFYGSHVKLTSTEYEKLFHELGASTLKDLIDRVNDYCAATGKSYKDYAAAIRNFNRNKSNNTTQRTKNETFKESVRQRQLEDYKRSNGGFGDNVIKFTE